MAQVKLQFGPYQDELDVSAFRSGAAIDTLNVTIDSNTIISGRKGFDVFNNDVGLIATPAVSLGKILNMFVAKFVDGDIYLVTKRSDGKLYWWKLSGTPSVGWTLIANKWPSGLHSTTDRGWFYMHADRMIYTDSIGGTKWSPDVSPNVWKAGIEASVGPLITAASGGGKEGWYHVTTTNVNSRTGEESIAGGLQATVSGNGDSVESRASEGHGGFTIPNWTGKTPPGTYPAGTGITDKTADLDFEFDWHNVYCTMGNTELIGLGAGTEMFSYEFYLEDSVATSTDASYSGIYRPDQLMARKPMHSYRGGQPPGAEFGCFNQTQAVYFEVYPKAKGSIPLFTFQPGNVATGLMMYSIPKHPSSVPQVSVFDIAASALDRERIVPAGGSNEMLSGIDGKITGVGTVGGVFFAFSETSTHQYTPASSGMHAAVVDPIRGAIGYNPVVSTPSSVHAIGKDTWLRISASGLQDISHEQFTPTIEAIPSTGIDATTGGYYTQRNEVWFAVAKAGDNPTKAQRILIWDEQKNELVAKYDPANLSTAGITSMVELAHPTQTPIMLVALDTGVILSWPGAGYDDEVVGGDNIGYATNWRGVVGQEQRANDRYVKRVAVTNAEIPTNGIKVAMAGIQSASEAAGADLIPQSILPTTNAPKTTRLTSFQAFHFDPVANGKMFVIELSSTVDQTANWKLGDILFEIDADNKS
ncbi:hypothetical protein HN747_05095 [archaeon]|nr:hypothetical protein [archaeon]